MMGNSFSGYLEKTEEWKQLDDEKIEAGESKLDSFPNQLENDSLESTEGLEEAKMIYQSLFEDDYDMEQVEDFEEKCEEFDDEGTYLEKEIAQSDQMIEQNIKNYETDDNGTIFKVDDKLLPNIEYEVNGNKYRTDDKGRIESVDAKPKSTPEGERDVKAQEQVGGKDRLDNDQGGHLVARILGGSKGIENMVAMWEKVNMGPYKTMENEIAKALADGKDVTLKIDITYENDSNRPSKIKVTYTIDGKETIVVFDNNEDSSELMNELQEIADDDACQDLQDEIQDARMNGENVSVMSLKQEYDEQGNLMDIVVCVRYDGENHYRMIAPKQED